VETEDNPFLLRIRRKSTKETLFELRDLEFSKYYISFHNGVVCSKFFFGLGERNQRGFRFREGIYTLYARDEPKIMENGHAPGKHVYSSHPVYLMREQSGNHHLFFYKTSSPMDFEYNGESMKFITIGGVVHFKLFLGNHDPNTAVKLYHQYLGGGWALHPFWSMGFHQSRWGYKTA
jgi:alpha-glucosidase/lysosomal alpha-glucosidase